MAMIPAVGRCGSEARIGLLVYIINVKKPDSHIESLIFVNDRGSRLMLLL
jgi:hypothetical protein